MISLARKNLLREKGRFIVSLFGVAFAVLLMLLLLGLYRGWGEQAADFVSKSAADVWVMQKGAMDISHSFSIIPNTMEETLRGVDGVEQAHLLVRRGMTLDVKGKEAKTAIFGFDVTSGFGGPTRLEKGSGKPGRGEIIVDASFAKKHDLRVGDELPILGRPFRIIGISAGGPIFQYTFISIEEAREIFDMKDISNYVLVSLKPGADVEDVMTQIRKILPGTEVQVRETFAENNKQEIVDIFLPIIAVLVVVSFCVGLTVISLTIYAATIEKAREFGVLKAVGAPDRHLARIVLEQSAVAGIAGGGVGIGLTYLVSWLASRMEPLFMTSIAWTDIVFVLGVVTVMVCGAALAPLRKVLRIDPAMVFRA